MSDNFKPYAYLTACRIANYQAVNFVNALFKPRNLIFDACSRIGLELA